MRKGDTSLTRLNRPFVFINSAMSADGKISCIERRRLRISGRADLSRVDLLRAKSDAVMVGVGTVLADDPGLRVKSQQLRQARLESGRPENPLRIVADSRARTPPSAHVLGPQCLIAATSSAPQDRLEELSQKCQIMICGIEREECGREQVDLTDLMAQLYERGVKRLMVEGGAGLNWSLLKLGLVDELYVYVGALLIGGESAPTLADGRGFREHFPRLALSSAKRLDEGVLLKWTLTGARPGPAELK
jgi:2,5-diamino-6-(ribosylamino)-4(3H)-pyrimidinone 5'-phosphate reductase